jgi:ribosomal protein L10
MRLRVDLNEVQGAPRALRRRPHRVASARHRRARSSKPRVSGFGYLKAIVVLFSSPALALDLSLTPSYSAHPLPLLYTPLYSQNPDMIKFRRALPEGAHMVVTKNTLMVKATEGTKWSAIDGCTTGMNAWLFVDENIAPAIKAVNELKKDWNKAGIECEFTGAVLDGKFVEPSGIKALEKLPTKKDLIQMVAVGIKQVPTKLARATKGVPSNLAYGVKAIADGESDLINA